MKTIYFVFSSKAIQLTDQKESILLGTQPCSYKLTIFTNNFVEKFRYGNERNKD